MSSMNTPLKARNAALALAKDISAIRANNPDIAPYNAVGRLMPVVDYCQNVPEAGQHIDMGREPNLLVEDTCNPDEYLLVAIHDVRNVPVEEKSGLCWISVNRGEVLLKPDTLVFWK